MDKVVEGVEEAKKEWAEVYCRTQEQIKEIEEYGKSREERNSNWLLRLNGLVQDGLTLLSSLQFKLDLLAPQLPINDEVQSATALLDSWKNQSHNLRLSGVKLDADVGAAGIDRSKLIHNYELAEECLQTNYYGARRMAETLISVLQLSSSPRIVNISLSTGKLEV